MVSGNRRRRGKQYRRGLRDEKSKAALMIGTSGAMRVAYRGDVPAKIPSGLWCYRIDRKRVIMGGALSDGGGLYQWLKENLRLTR